MRSLETEKALMKSLTFGHKYRRSLNNKENDSLGYDLKSTHPDN